MIRFAFFTLTLLLSSQLNAQKICKRTISDFGVSSGDYTIKGSALLYDSLGTLYLRLSPDFSTDAGPDLHLYLAIKDEAPTKTGNTHVEIAKMTSNTGAQQYTVPGNHKIDDFNYLLVHCKQHNHFWDGGQFGTKDCSTSVGIQSITTSSFKMYPNPTRGALNIVSQSNETIKQVQIYNSTGQLMLQTSSSELDLQHFSNGLYYITLATSNGAVYQSTVLKN